MAKGVDEKKLTSQLPGSGQSWAGMLEAVPIRNVAAETGPDSSGEGALRIAVPTRPASWYKLPPVRWIVRPPARRVVVLDRRGAELWFLCDGKRSVEELVDLCAKKYRLSFHESRVSVTSYLRLLLERGALAIAI